MARSRALRRIRRVQRRRAMARPAPGSKARSEARQKIKEQQGMVVSTGTGFGLGFSEKQGWPLPTIDKIDPTFLYTMAALAGTFFIKDKQVRELLKNTTVGLAAVTAYKAGKNGVESLFNYAKPVPVAAAGWGEEILEAGEF